MAKQIKERLSRVFDIPQGIFGEEAFITIVGTKEINIEGYMGIIEYTSTMVRLNTKKKILKITGADMEIAGVSREYIVITGQIIGVEYI